MTSFLAILNLKTRFLGHFDWRPKGRKPDSNYPRGTLGGHEKKSTKNDKNNTPPLIYHTVVTLSHPETIKEVPSQDNKKTKSLSLSFTSLVNIFIISRTVAHQAKETVPSPSFRVQFSPAVQVNMINPKRFQVLLFDKRVNYLPFPGN